MLIDRRYLLRSAAPALAAATLLPASAFAEAAKKKPGAVHPAARPIAVKDVNGLTVFSSGGRNVVALSGPEGAPRAAEP